MTATHDVLPAISALLAASGISATLVSAVPLAIGGNNRTFRVVTSAGDFAVKQYFRHAGDERDRLGTEFAFLEYAHQVAPGTAPKPLHADRSHGMALYEFVAGRRYTPEDIGEREVVSAAHFFMALNATRARSLAKNLPVASEACFSVSDHLNLVTRRLAQLQTITPGSDEDSAALALLARIRASWEELNMQVRHESGRCGVEPERALDADQRCISPSDFGFHNALAQADGSARFLDFEYAGWDDPAKLMGDFFAQVAVPVPGHLFELFAQMTLSCFPEPDALAWRAALLRPVYRVKWCCITLNIFLPVNLARRRFADPLLDERTLKRQQLAKATELFQSLTVSDHGLH
jgi:hypothetical protein